jgi:hypothetical protein
MTRELEHIISSLSSKKDYFREKYGVRRIGIYGSYTRNDFRPESDVDLLVDVDPKIGWYIVDLGFELEKVLGKKVDLATEINPNYWPYIKEDIVYV